MKKLYKFRIFPLLFSIILTTLSFIYMSSISLPYIDPTFSMNNKQMLQIKNAEIVVNIGFYAIIISVIFLIGVVLLRKRGKGKNL